MTDPPLPLLLRVVDAASYAGVGKHHAYELVASGAWVSLRRGRRLLVVRRSVEKWVEQLAPGGAADAVG